MMDLPKSLSPTEAIHWASDLKSPDAALYYPWILDESEVRPSSPSIAAAYQLSDRRYGISDTPANRALDSKLTPLMHLSQIQASQLNLNRINTLLYFRDQSARIWGTETLRLRDDSEFQFISTRRTMKALTEAMTTICESFVLEPLKEDISLIVSNELEDFCLAHKYLFNLEKQKPYRIQVNAVTSTDSSGLHVDCEFHLNTCIEAIQISIGLRN
jgi:phage tail sheath protein FI